MLQIKDLTKQYAGNPEPSLDSVSFRVDKGDFVALLGPNGAGKSTLINILSGLVEADRGTAELHGHPLTDKNRRLRTRIGVVPQEISFDVLQTVDEALSFRCGALGYPLDKNWKEKLLQDLTLLPHRRKKVRELSGGMKRRLLIAQALIHKPDLLLLDEPTTGIDIKLREETYGFLRDLNEQGLTIILTTHYLQEAERLCRRILVLNKGILSTDQTMESLLKTAGNTFSVRIADHSGGSRETEYSADEFWTFLREIPDRKKEVKELTVNRPSLEKIFLQLTKDERKDTWTD